MPYVDIKLAGKITVEQRREIAKGVSEIISKVANKPSDSIYISFTEFDRSEFAKGKHMLKDLDDKKNLFQN